PVRVPKLPAVKNATWVEHPTRGRTPSSAQERRLRGDPIRARKSGIERGPLSEQPISPIDRFVLAKLEQKGLAPSPPADRRTLIRRAYFDLIGLPPTAAEVATFVADRSPDAFAKVVDRLLASPRY